MAASVGAVVSRTVIVNDPVVGSPPVSVALQLIVFGPRGRTTPTAGLQDGVGGTASSLSEAVTTYAAVAPPVVLPSTVESAGKWSVGGVLACPLGTSMKNSIDGLEPWNTVPSLGFGLVRLRVQENMKR